MRIVIFANGIIENVNAEVSYWVRPDDLLVAADGGTHHVLAAGLIPMHIIGDMDSLQTEHQDLVEQGAVLHTYPAQKDETDLELALLWAVEQNPQEIIVLGALGGRPDQEWANLLLLAHPALDGHNVVFANATWAIRLIRGNCTLNITGQPGDILSLIPLGGDAQGVTTQGLAYPLRNETLYFGKTRGVSNVFEETKAIITLKKGLLWCFHKHSEY